MLAVKLECLLDIGIFYCYMSQLYTGTQITHLLFFNCKIGDFKIAGRVSLQKKVCLPSLLQGIFGDFLDYALKTN